MALETGQAILVERQVLVSKFLQRSVTIDCYLPTDVSAPEQLSLLLINDGQDMEELGLKEKLESMIGERLIVPVVCVGIHASSERKMEYGTAGIPDCKGRGAKAGLYTSFIFEELIPYIHSTYKISSFKEKAFAGFSLGGLSALDICWRHPGVFTKVGVFSGSLWWRRKDMDEGYNEETDRIMHQIIKETKEKPPLQFFFQTGTEDEIADRNNNGIIDAIDDTLSLIDELKYKGYQPGKDIIYLELQGGKHDVATWGKAMPDFLLWCYGKNTL